MKLPPSSGSSSSSGTPGNRIGDGQVAIGDRIAVRVAVGIAERGGDPLLEVLADVVLEHLGLVVDLVPGHPEGLGEERLEQPVMADHLEGHPLPRRGQLDAPVGLVADQAELGHPLDHRRHRSRRDAEPLGEGRGPDRPRLARGERVDGLRVVLDRLRAGSRAGRGRGCPACRRAQASIRPREVVLDRHREKFDRSKLWNACGGRTSMPQVPEPPPYNPRRWRRRSRSTPSTAPCARRRACSIAPSRARIVGPRREAAEFLQGQLTNDVEALEPGRAATRRCSTARGRSAPTCGCSASRADEFLIDTEPALGRSRSASTSACTRSAATPRSRPARRRAAAALPDRPADRRSCSATPRSAPSTPTATCSWPAARLPGDRHRPRAPTCSFPAEAVDAVRDWLTANGRRAVSERAAEIVRVEAGRPRVGHEISEQTMPQEAGINERAVSFTKGCYIGQETVARLHYKGKPNRHLRRLKPLEPRRRRRRVSAGGKRGRHRRDRRDLPGPGPAGARDPAPRGRAGRRGHGRRHDRGRPSRPIGD